MCWGGTWPGYHKIMILSEEMIRGFEGDGVLRGLQIVSYVIASDVHFCGLSFEKITFLMARIDRIVFYFKHNNLL